MNEPAARARAARQGGAAATLLCLALAGCVTAPDPHHRLAHQLIEPGALLTLHAPLRVPPNRTRVYLQGGPVQGVSQMEPHCILEVSTLSETARTVAPDTFEVWRVRRSILPFDVFAGGGVLAAGLRRAGDEGDGGGPSQVFYATELWLRSSRQPDVMRLTCRSDQMTPSGAAAARHLTLDEVRQTLGSTLTVEPRAGAPAGGPSGGGSGR